MGTYSHDELQGPGQLVHHSGAKTIGTFVDDQLHGEVTEYDANGAVVYKGLYDRGQRHGPGQLWLPDGGLFQGTWDHGQLHGADIVYSYNHKMFPAFKLVGSWDHGVLQKARIASDALQLLRDSVPDNVLPGVIPSTVGPDVATTECIAQQPQLVDVYEQYLVEVKQSPIAGEGLFARRHIPGDCVVSFYNGLKVPQSEVDGRDWALNSNTITLSVEDEAVIDVPKEWSFTAQYCASMGHKANHGFGAQRNAKYDTFDHPRFGPIKCVRTTRPVKPGEEILVSVDTTSRCVELVLRRGLRVCR